MPMGVRGLIPFFPSHMSRVLGAEKPEIPEKL